jgi:hypothetical protein
MANKAERIARQLLQGASFGFSDEVIDTLSGLGTAGLTDMTLEEAMAMSRNRSKKELASDWKEAPVTSFLSQAAGGVPLGFTKAGLSAANWLRGGSALQGVGKGAALGAGLGATAGVGAADDTVSDRATGGAIGAGLGAVLGGATAPLSRMGVGSDDIDFRKVTDKTAKGFENKAQKELARQLSARPDLPEQLARAENMSQAAQRSGIQLTLPEMIAQSGSDPLLAQQAVVGSNPMTAGRMGQMYAARSGTPQQAGQIEQRLMQLAQQLDPSVGSYDDAARSVIGQADDASRRITNELSAKAKPLYDEAYKKSLGAIDDYKMSHTAPSRAQGENVTLDNPIGIFGDDIYSQEATRYFGTGSNYDKKTIDIIQSMRGNPNKEVTIYRAVPKNISANINDTDWVTLTKEYAKQHGDAVLDGNYDIISKNVTAKDLATDGNSIHEWGLDFFEKPNLNSNNDILQNPLIQSALQKARSNPVYAQEIGDLPDNSIQALDVVKRSLDDMAANAASNQNRNESRLINNARAQLLQAMDEAAPEYAQARQIYSGNPDALQMRERIGALADIDPMDARSVGRNLFSGTQQNADLAAQTLGEKAPTAAAARIYGAMDELRNDPVNIASRIAPDKRSSDMLRSYAGKNAGDIEETLNVINQAKLGERSRFGSPTQPRQVAEQTLENAAGGALNTAVDIKTGGVTAMLRKASQMLGRGSQEQDPQFYADMADLMLTEQGMDLLRRVASGQQTAIQELQSIGLPSMITGGVSRASIASPVSTAAVGGLMTPNVQPQGQQSFAPPVQQSLPQGFIIQNNMQELPAGFILQGVQ